MVYMYIVVYIIKVTQFLKQHAGGGEGGRKGGEGRGGGRGEKGGGGREYKCSHNTSLKITCHVATGEPVMRYSK